MSYARGEERKAQHGKNVERRKKSIKTTQIRRFRSAIVWVRLKFHIFHFSYALLCCLFIFLRQSRWISKVVHTNHGALISDFEFISIAAWTYWIKFFEPARDTDKSQAILKAFQCSVFSLIACWTKFLSSFAVQQKFSQMEMRMKRKTFHYLPEILSSRLWRKKKLKISYKNSIPAEELQTHSKAKRGEEKMFLKLCFFELLA